MYTRSRRLPTWPKRMEDWRRCCNEVRPHGSMGNKPPLSLTEGSSAAAPPAPHGFVKPRSTALPTYYLITSMTYAFADLCRPARHLCFRGQKSDNTLKEVRIAIQESLFPHMSPRFGKRQFQAHSLVVKPQRSPKSPRACEKLNGSSKCVFASARRSGAAFNRSVQSVLSVSRFWSLMQVPSRAAADGGNRAAFPPSSRSSSRGGSAACRPRRL
jgi:hypothetical protein